MCVAADASYEVAEESSKVVIREPSKTLAMFPRICSQPLPCLKMYLKP